MKERRRKPPKRPFPHSAEKCKAQRDEDLPGIVQADVRHAQALLCIFPEGVQDQHDVADQEKQGAGGEEAGKGRGRGDEIGEVGSTGRSTAPHLHYEVRKNDQTENPVNYYYTDLTPEEYEEMINVSSQMTMSFD